MVFYGFEKTFLKERPGSRYQRHHSREREGFDQKYCMVFLIGVSVKSFFGGLFQKALSELL